MVSPDINFLMSSEAEVGELHCGLGLNLLALRKNKVVGVERFVRNVVGHVTLPEQRSMMVAARVGADLEEMLGAWFIKRYRNLEFRQWYVGNTATRIILEMIALSVTFFNCRTGYTLRKDGKTTVLNFDTLADDPRTSEKLWWFFAKPAHIVLANKVLKVIKERAEAGSAS